MSKNILFQRKVVSMRLSRDLKRRIEHFYGFRTGQTLHNLHADYSFSFALRELVLAGVDSLEEDLGIDSELSKVQVRSFSKKRNVSKEDVYSCHVSCSMPVYLINRVCGVASVEGYNRAEAFRAVLERGLRELRTTNIWIP